MRRALAALTRTPGYILTDGFPVRGLSAPALAMWKGDQVAACVAAASVIAKVTRDALMCDLDKAIPHYGFSRHKGYSTRSHMRALDELGPSVEHRRSFVNVRGRLITGLEPDPDALMEPGLERLERPGEASLEVDLEVGEADLAIDLEQGPEAAHAPGREVGEELLAPGQDLVDAGIGSA
jgi:ribonuclease HII